MLYDTCIHQDSFKENYCNNNCLHSRTVFIDVTLGLFTLNVSRYTVGNFVLLYIRFQY
jgi:hypothetical protein